MHHYEKKRLLDRLSAVIFFGGIIVLFILYHMGFME